MKVIYQGPHSEVDVALGDGRRVRAEQGKPVDLPSDVAENLVEQGWDEVTSGSKKQSDKEAPASTEPSADAGEKEE